MKEILDKLFQHATLSHDEARGLMGDIMGGRFTDAQLAALMTVFRMRSVTAEELTGFREALLATRLLVDLSEFQPIDIVGTGGTVRTRSTFRPVLVSSWPGLDTMSPSMGTMVRRRSVGQAT